MIRRDRLKALLLDLIRIDSISRRERETALRLKQELESMGAEVLIDDAGDPHPLPDARSPSPAPPPVKGGGIS